jgi:hypothetical protein
MCALRAALMSAANLLRATVLFALLLRLLIPVSLYVCLALVR